jgi:hypothetical protein
MFRGRSDIEVLRMVRDANLQTLNEFGWHIAIDLRAILEKAMAHHVADRFGSAGEFRDALAEWLQGSGARTGAHELAAFLREIEPR